MRVFLITAAALSLSFYGPSAQAQESDTQALDRAYCDSVELGHPDLERCEAFLEELVAEEELLNEMVAEPRLIAAETTEHRENSLETRATDATTGNRAFDTSVGAVLGGVKGVAIGYIVGMGTCWIVGAGDPYLGCDLTGLVWGGAGGFFGFLIGAKKGWRASSGEDTQVSLSPYRQDDASGVMFSGQF